MKDQFENRIKELVEDYSYPYDAQAWTNLSKKLPAPKSSFSWLGKLAVAAVLSTAVVALYLNFAGQNTDTNTLKTEKSKQTQATPIQEEKDRLTNGASSDHQNTKNKTQNKEQGCTFIIPNVEAFSRSNPENYSAINELNNAITNGLVEASPERQIPVATLAQASIENTSEQSSNIPKIEENQAQPCNYKIALSAEAINYESGVPVVRIHAETTAPFSWSANGTIANQKSKSIELYAWKQQTYKVSAKLSQEECNLTESIQIQQDQTYNLLAVNAFNPQSRDDRNAHFMPYALTIRDTPFELVIIDPDNGAVIFKTSDAQNAWDGIDQRSGQLVVAQKAYIWKVVLARPLAGEKNTYTGTIVRI
ncbi:MAG: hypothetical protein RLZZ65_636 [Bacteroidota bacterium]|jgi:cytoskeletal protein RodZ